ncbi:hypothetical protein [Youngiibacter fragilis]|uniref:Uncharacterized protein n=1 Tax=Youngiibacter fragilis 232.1 TaxID=994573 RepID=V7I4D5_9CLOT|nr:hypothetical protein [Youngiibacter fragilis]ETA80146.1 hypothetical protein T472_0213245 [Youngiibacter fragilis 232.1]
MTELACYDKGVYHDFWHIGKPTESISTRNDKEAIVNDVLS